MPMRSRFDQSSSRIPGSRLRVAFVSQPWSRFQPPVRESDSVSLWTYQVAQRLIPRAEVIVYSRRMRGQAFFEMAEGIECRRFPSLHDHQGWKRARRMLRRIGLAEPHVSSPRFHFDYALRVAMDLRKRDCDVVHVHNFSQFVPLIRAACPRARIVLHMHCEWLSQLDPSIVESRLRHADTVLGCSAHLVGLMDRKAAAAFGRVRRSVLYNGVDVDLLGNVPSLSRRGGFGCTLLFVGRVSPEKGLHVLVDAFRRVVEVHPDARLVVVGPDIATPHEYIVELSDEPHVQALAEFYPGSYLEALKRRIDPSLRDRVSFVGEVPHEELSRYYQSADLLVNPSLVESFGMSLVEAMASGVPVVATRVGGMKEIVDPEETGLLVGPGDPEELAKALIRLLDDAPLRMEMGRTGRERVARFSWANIADAAADVYRRLVGEEFAGSVRGGRLRLASGVRPAESPGSVSGTHSVRPAPITSRATGTDALGPSSTEEP